MKKYTDNYNFSMENYSLKNFERKEKINELKKKNHTNLKSYLQKDLEILPERNIESENTKGSILDKEISEAKKNYFCK